VNFGRLRQGEGKICMIIFAKGTTSLLYWCLCRNEGAV